MPGSLDDQASRLGFREREHMLWWLFVGTRGGPMRLKIVAELLRSPANANQLAQRLGVNYRTIKHHLEVLVEAGLVVPEGPKYGQLYYPSKTLRDVEQRLREIAKEVGVAWP